MKDWTEKGSEFIRMPLNLFFLSCLYRILDITRSDFQCCRFPRPAVLENHSWCVRRGQLGANVKPNEKILKTIHINELHSDITSQSPYTAFLFTVSSSTSLPETSRSFSTVVVWTSASSRSALIWFPPTESAWPTGSRRSSNARIDTWNTLMFTTYVCLALSGSVLLPCPRLCGCLFHDDLFMRYGGCGVSRWSCGYHEVSIVNLCIKCPVDAS